MGYVLGVVMLMAMGIVGAQEADDYARSQHLVTY
jgi:hypothetical protein